VGEEIQEKINSKNKKLVLKKIPNNTGKIQICGEKNMRKNKNFKRLVSISIAAILFLSIFVVASGSTNQYNNDDYPDLLPVMEKMNRQGSNDNSGSFAISDAGLWLLGQQDIDGWFPWTPSGGATRNTQGPSARGLLYAYEVTGDNTFLDAAIECGDYMVDVMYQGLGPNPSVYTDGDPRFATHDPMFLEELSIMSSISKYADFVQTWLWDKLNSGTYGESNNWDAEDFGDYVVDARNSQGIVALSPWDISGTTIGALIGGETGIVTDLMGSIKYGLELTTIGDFYDSIGLAGAIWSSAETGIDLDPLAGAYALADSTIDLADILKDMRTDANPKGWLWASSADPADYTNGDTQTTAFALAALAKLDFNSYLSYICEGIEFIKSMQQLDGQYIIYPGASTTESGGVETHAEAIFGMATAGRVKNIDTDEVFCSIQTAIDDPETLDGHTLEVAAGTYIEDATSFCDINLDKDLSIIGAGSANTFIELTQGKGEGLQIINGDGSPTDITIEGITFTRQIGSTNSAKRPLRVFINLNSLTLNDVVIEYAEVNNLEINGDITTLIINDCDLIYAGSNGLMCPGDIGSGAISNSNFDHNGRLDVWASGMHLFGLTSNLDIIGCSMSYNTDSGFNGRQLSNIYFEDITASYNTHSGGGGGICISEKASSSTNIEMVDVTAEYNGRDGILVWTWYDYTSISDVTITGGLFTNNGWAGIRVLNWPASGSTGGTIDNVIITEAHVENNPFAGIWFELDYGSSTAGSSLVQYNNIIGNVNYGILNSGDGQLNAKCNWWGDISGPNGVGPGTGDIVSDNVIYCPWLTDEYPLGDCLGGAVCWNKDTGEYFCSIQKAIDDPETNDGDTIEVFAGTHPGNIIVYKEVIIESQDGAASTIIDASVIDYSIYENSYGHGINYAWSETNDPGLLKNGFMIWSDHVTINGFTILNAAWPSQYNRGIGILIGSIHTTYAGFIPWNIDQWGGIIPNPDEPTPTGVVIKNNIIDAASDGIYNWASNYNTFEYNTVTNSVAVGGVGIQCYEGGTNNIIRNNIIDNVDGSGISICGAWPDVLLDVSNTQIHDNIVTNSNYGIQFYNVAGSNADAYNNNILGNNKGVVVEGAGGSLVGHANYNNIVGNNIGVENTAPDGIFDAECNWYGSALGPTHPSNPIGVGDSVSDNVDYLPWLNLPFEDPNVICGAGMCQDIVYVDDDYTSSTPGWYIDHFPTIQVALERLSSYGTAIIYDGIYDEDLIIDDDNCDNTGITIKGAYECFPTQESAVIIGHATILVDYVTIQFLEFTPNTQGAITVGDGIVGTTLECNKFRKDCVADAIGVEALSRTGVNAELNWWGRPDGPQGGLMDDGKTADGNGVMITGPGDVFVEPWIGIHAEIAEPMGTIEVQLDETVNFDATGSFAYSFGECCEPTELQLQYLWDFGDDFYSADKECTHLFDQPGTYEVSLMVDAPGITGLYSNFMYDWAYVTVHVITEDTPLTADADGGNLGGYNTIIGEPVQLYGDAYGGSGEYSWFWNFGDDSADSTDQNPTHIYTEPGTYTATLTVISDGETAIDTADVIVYDIDELFVKISDSNTFAGEETMFSASINGGTQPYMVSWDFGDGTTSDEINPTHIYTNPGEYTVTVFVTDDNGKTAEDTAIITVEEETIPESAEIKVVKGGFGILALIDSGSQECNYDINIEGFVIIGGSKTGVIEANMEETVDIGFSLAFGRVTITISAGQQEKTFSAFALGPFYLNLKEI